MQLEAIKSVRPRRQIAAAAVFRVQKRLSPGRGEDRVRAGLLTYGEADYDRQGRRAFSGLPNDRLSPPAPFPRLQRRYRPGFTPGFLFSRPGHTPGQTLGT